MLFLPNFSFRKVTLFEELQLLKEFEKRENVLAEKVEAKIKEKTDMYLKVIRLISFYLDSWEKLSLWEYMIKNLHVMDKLVQLLLQAV